MAGTFNYRLKEKYQSKTCVVKYWFGQKYFIWKALHLKQGCDQVFRDLNNKIARYKLGTLPETDLFFKVAKYCSMARVTVALVEVLLETDDHCLLAEFDRVQVAAAADDVNCLNLSGDQYLPGWLKCVTSNKALQSIISPPASIPTEVKLDLKPEPKEIAVAPKLTPTEPPAFAPADILKRILAAKNA